MAPQTLTIDGSHGEGGGQIVRSCLSLSLVTGRSFIIDNIRARRPKPGLLRQHLTAVQAAAEICGGTMEGAELRSKRLSFMPGPIRAGSYTFRIGTAGSTTLVLQTILPALMVAEAPSTVLLEGGTHNPLAPPFEFLKTSFLPLLARMGPSVNLTLERYGFYPAGGGRIRAAIIPSRDFQKLTATEGGKISNGRVRALVAHLPDYIGWRECRTIARGMHWDERCCTVETVSDSDGPGNVVFAEVERAGVCEVFSGFGQRGVPAEKVAGNVVNQIQRYCRSEAPIGEYLADQLLLPVGIGVHLGSRGDEFRTMDLSLHALTHMDILRAFLAVQVNVEQTDRDDVTVRILPR